MKKKNKVILIVTICVLAVAIIAVSTTLIISKMRSLRRPAAEPQMEEETYEAPDAALDWMDDMLSQHRSDSVTDERDDLYVAPTEAQRVEELIAALVSWEVVSGDGEQYTLRITAPDVYALLKEADEDGYEEKDEFGEEIREELEDGDYDWRTSEVTVALIEGDDGSEQFEQTFEFVDAVYGGLLSYISEKEEAREQ